jgi:hypothetical protein
MSNTYHKFEIVKTKLKRFSVEIPLTFTTNIGFGILKLFLIFRRKSIC